MPDFRFPAPPREEQETNRPPLNPPISQTARALPLSQEARAVGQGSPSDAPSDEPGSEDAPPLFVGDPIEIPDAPEAPQAPDLPRVDPEKDFPGGRPQRDQGARNEQALVGLLSAVGAALAPRDSPVAFNVASGLSQGAARQARTSEEEFRQRQQAFQEFVTDAQRFNRQARQAEAEREFESQLQNFESRMGEREQAIEAELERQRAARERRQEVWDDYRDHQQSIEQIQTRGRQRRDTARARAQSGGGEESGPSMDKLNRQLVETGRAMSTTATQLEAARQKLSEMGNTDSGRDLVQDRIGRLQEKLDGLQREQARITAQINQRGGAEGEAAARGTGGGRQPAPSSSASPTDSTPAAPAPTRRDTSRGGAQGGGTQGASRQGANRRSAGAQPSGQQSGEDRINQRARQQAAKVDTVTQADIGAAVEEFGEGAPQVKLLRRIRQIQQNQ